MKVEVGGGRVECGGASVYIGGEVRIMMSPSPGTRINEEVCDHDKFV